MFRAILVATLIGLYLILGLPVLGIIAIIRMNNHLLGDRLARAGLSWICRLSLWAAGTKVVVSGLENIPKDEAVLFVGNHTSYFDILVNLAQPIPLFGFIAKRELSRVPSLRLWMRCIDCIFLDREDIRAAMEVLKKASENIQKGISVFIFPEGTRFHEELPLEFKGGSFKIATKTNAPIIPVSINRCDDIFEKHIPFVKPATIRLKYGKPIYPNNLPKEERRNIAEYVRGIVTEMFLND